MAVLRFESLDSEKLQLEFDPLAAPTFQLAIAEPFLVLKYTDW